MTASPWRFLSWGWLFGSLCKTSAASREAVWPLAKRGAHHFARSMWPADDPLARNNSNNTAPLP